MTEICFVQGRTWILSNIKDHKNPYLFGSKTNIHKRSCWKENKTWDIGSMQLIHLPCCEDSDVYQWGPYIGNSEMNVL